MPAAISLEICQPCSLSLHFVNWVCKLVQSTLFIFNIQLTVVVKIYGCLIIQNRLINNIYWSILKLTNTSAFSLKYLKCWQNLFSNKIIHNKLKLKNFSNFSQRMSGSYCRVRTNSVTFSWSIYFMSAVILCDMYSGSKNHL